jgi:CHAD domain-containing protein
MARSYGEPAPEWKCDNFAARDRLHRNAGTVWRMSTETEKETDKLGPLSAPPVAAGLPLGDAALRRAVVSAFRDAITAAEAATREPDVDDAVHEVRKALRRARATAHLVADCLPKDDRRDITRALGDARGKLSATRDLSVAPAALAAIELDDASRAAADAVVAHAQTTRAPSDDLRAAIADAVAAVKPLPDVMAAALPEATDFSVVRDGLAETYRRARKSLKKARRSRASFHDFRKRTKELTYQLELLAAGVDGHVEALRRELADLGDDASAVVDAIMLRDFLEAHAPEGDARPEGLTPLLDAIDEHLDDKIRSARKGARDVFDRRARKWAKKVGKAVRRDHVPAPVAHA